MSFSLADLFFRVFPFAYLNPKSKSCLLVVLSDQNPANLLKIHFLKTFFFFPYLPSPICVTWTWEKLNFLLPQSTVLFYLFTEAHINFCVWVALLDTLIPEKSSKFLSFFFLPLLHSFCEIICVHAYRRASTKKHVLYI